MKNVKSSCGIALAISLVFGSPVGPQVQTEVPAPVPGAKPVTMEHIKVHGAALEGNLEGDAVDRDVFVFLPPGYAKKNRVATQSSTLCTTIPSAPSNGLTKSRVRKR
jgi:hypothetical protein